MGTARTIGAAILLPALATVWACSGSVEGPGSASGDGGGVGSGGGGPCGPQSCATGCCDDNGVCQPGTSDEACGTGNIACQNCSSLGQTCQQGDCSNGTGGGSSGAPAGGSSSGAASSSGGYGFPSLFDAGLRPQRDAGLPQFPQFDAGILRGYEGGFSTYPGLDGGFVFPRGDAGP